MKQHKLKRPDGSISILNCDNDPSMFIPEGWELLPDQDLPAGHIDAMEADENGSISLSLSKLRTLKVNEIRARRDQWLKKSDEAWVELKSKGQSTADIEEDKDELRALPQLASDELADLDTKEEIEAYDAFEMLAMSRSYE